MNRRDFLKLIGKAALVSAFPIKANLAGEPITKDIVGVNIFAQTYDYGHSLGVSVDFIYKGERIRNGIRIIGQVSSSVKNITPAITESLNGFLRKYNLSVTEESVNTAVLGVT